MPFGQGGAPGGSKLARTPAKKALTAPSQSAGEQPRSHAPQELHFDLSGCSTLALSSSPLVEALELRPTAMQVELAPRAVPVLNVSDPLSLLSALAAPALSPRSCVR
jgi:hypothetical protein